MLTRDDIFAVLDGVMDPEVPVLSVMELGIVRDVEMDDARSVTVVVTPTYSGCPAMQVIEEDIVAALRARGVEHARVRTTYAQAWTTDWMSDEAKAKLEAYGIAPPGRVPTGDEGLISLRRRPDVVRCPYCKSADTELRSEFGSTACKSIRFCNACQQPFEQFKAI
ncbi:MAG: phenylacetate-CoA oxygenase subunit PaaJ [Gemmatimonadota bacterium]|nr:phenylacetate-CoA oxygenase subunit PaaJ [Gemmatimonadota bacterium]